MCHLVDINGRTSPKKKCCTSIKNHKTRFSNMPTFALRWNLVPWGTLFTATLRMYHFLIPLISRAIVQAALAGKNKKCWQLWLNHSQHAEFQSWYPIIIPISFRIFIQLHRLLNLMFKDISVATGKIDQKLQNYWHYFPNFWRSHWQKNKVV